MKCNINSKINTNSMANIFGPEFDLTTEEIINTIKKVYKCEVIDFTFDPLDVEVALYNNDYYIKPGDTKKRFLMECGKAFEEIKPLYGKMDDNFLNFGYIIRVLSIIKKFFDESYFEEQIERRKKSVTLTVNKDKLRTYLNKLDRDELELFLNMVITCRLELGLFITDVSSNVFWMKINESCRAVGINVPKEFDIVEAHSFFNNNKNYYFNSLSIKTIANMLCDAIDLDIEIASSAAKKLYYSGYDAMINYINSKISLSN